MTEEQWSLPHFLRLAKHREIGYNEVVMQTGDGMYGTEN